MRSDLGVCRTPLRMMLRQNGEYSRGKSENFFAHVLSDESLNTIFMKLHAVVRTERHCAQSFADIANEALSLRNDCVCRKFASRTPSANSFLM